MKNILDNELCEGFSELEAQGISFEYPIVSQKIDLGLSIAFDFNQIIVGYSSVNSFFRALQVIKTRGLKEAICLKEKCAFQEMAFMVDCSRDAVLTVESVKKTVRFLALSGYNQLQLYTEDTYEVDNEPLFGYMRGRYSKTEIKDIDSYCKKFGIELVPCVQGLAHYNALKRWCLYPLTEYSMDCEDILLAGDQRTYQLIENIFKTLSECFTSRIVNIGMDEAHMMGLGAYLEKNGYKEKSEIFFNHLNRIVEIAKRYGFILMMWSDMLFKIEHGGGFYSEKGLSENVKRQIPEDIRLIYWDYYKLNVDGYNTIMQNHLSIGNEIAFAGGIWNWPSFAPQSEFGLKAVVPAIECCLQNKIKYLIMTAWGDNGGDCPHYSGYNMLLIAAEKAYGNNDMDYIEKSFSSLTGYSLQDFRDLGLPNVLREEFLTDTTNPCKYLLYNDLFLGLYDSALSGKEKEYYISHAKILNAKPNSGEYSFLFSVMAKLCEVLAVKCDLGVRTRNAYLDKNQFNSILSDYDALIDKVNAFYRVFKDQWFRLFKPFGFEVHDIRIGGLLLRINSCKERIADYCNNKIDRIEELETPIINIYNGRQIPVTKWTDMVTTGVI